MEKEKSNKKVIALLIIIIVILLVLCILFATETISFKSNQPNNENNKPGENITDNIDDNNTTVENTTQKYFYNVEELNVKTLSEYSNFSDISENTNIVEKIDFGYDEYEATLDLSGNVNIIRHSETEETNTKLNISGVIDIIHFSVPSVETEQLLYLLTDNGDVYYYKIKNVEENNYNVTKVENVSDVKKIFISNSSKENAGSSWALFAITNNNDCIMINGQSI